METDVGKSEQNFTHDEALSFLREKMDEILGHPLLCDLRPDVTIEEVNSLISLEHGQAMSIRVNRADDEFYDVIVNQNATIKDLKSAIQRHFMLKMQRENGPLHISWKYVWKSYWLYFQGQKLKDDNERLSHFGLRDKDEICFIKRLKEK